MNEYFFMTDEKGEVVTLDQCVDERQLTFWLIRGGEVQGNLTKLSYRRAEGEERTRKMLEKYDDEMLTRLMVFATNYYVDNGYLYLRIPYYDDKAKYPGWLANGAGQVWQGWLVIRLEDIQEWINEELRESIKKQGK